MCDWILKIPLEGFAQDAPRKELVINPVVEYLTATVW